MNDEIKDLARQTLTAAKAKGLRLSCAESCTGGLIAAALTSVSGASDAFDCGFVTYSNDAKTRMLGVDANLISQDGAVSQTVARSMAEGTISTSGADISVAVTGIAGPNGGSAEKPVGLVHLAASNANKTTHHQRCIFPGSRDDIRSATVCKALEMLINIIDHT